MPPRPFLFFLSFVVLQLTTSFTFQVMRSAQQGFIKEDDLNKRLEDGMIKWLTDCSNDDKQHEWVHSFGTTPCPEPVRFRAAQVVHEANVQSSGAFFVLTFPMILPGDRGMGGPPRTEYHMRLRRERALEGQLVPKATELQHVQRWLSVCIKHVEDRKLTPPQRFVLPHEVSLSEAYYVRDLASNGHTVHEWKDKQMVRFHFFTSSHIVVILGPCHLS